MAYIGFEFRAAFPEDGIEQGEGDDWEIVRPNGMAMSIAIVDLLKGADVSATEPEADIEHYCWVSEIAFNGWHMVCRCYALSDDEQFLFIQGHSPVFKRLFKRQDPFVDMLRSLYELLTGDPRFEDVQWIDLGRRPIAPLS